MIEIIYNPELDRLEFIQEIYWITLLHFEDILIWDPQWEPLPGIG